MKLRAFSLCILLNLTACAHAKNVTPIPVPENIKVTSSQPREIIWNALTDKEKKLAYHLTEAARAGRAILFYQNHRHGLLIKSVLDGAFSKHDAKDLKTLLGEEGFQEFVSYAAKFNDLSGPYEPSNRKYVLRKVTPVQVENLFKIHAPKADAADRHEAVLLMTDPNYETMRMPEGQDGEGIEKTGGNLYEKGITAEELKTAFQAGLTLANCLGCRVVRDYSVAGAVSLKIEKLTTATSGPVGRALKEVVRELKLALPFATNDLQATQISTLVRYLEKGDVEDFRQSNIAWVKGGTSTKVDFMMGFVEVYEDFKASIGSWESYVQIIDPKTTEMSVRLAKNAQYFENKMPYGEFKKTFPSDYSPPALMVYYFLENSSMHTAGYNLPNFDDIRRDIGFKNAIRLDLPGSEKDPAIEARWKEVFEQFAPASRFALIEKHHDKAWRLIVLLHEIIGHGSGTYDESKYGKGIDPVSALGNMGSALEEQRADLAALTFASDPALVDVGYFKSQDEATAMRDAMYDFYTADFLRRTARDRTLQEAHQRGHWLFVSQLLKRGAVAWAARDGSSSMTPENMVLLVKDHNLYHEVAKDLLAELQRIKATRDEAELKRLFNDEAPLDEINKPWAQAMIARGERVHINAGAVEQPWRVSKDGKFRLLTKSLTLEGVAPYWAH